ncbi:expressed unknown protein [Seminavis robusta]|uniref:Uncharacterized protein n=1 Tax=Seminavis robusta TaxID=568900 RepID=A0A9N8H9T6_9STRA|nr:expressed unknown protein [Seminavis robusta]|eukprot:Sro267_g103490.1 n/a (279) ;mRNA; f:59885-60721
MSGTLDDDAPVEGAAINEAESTADLGVRVCMVAANKLSAANIPACSIRPYCLFVAWNGVLTLVYEGFPPSLIQAKEIMSSSIPNLKKENFGSKWPKSTLAAVFDTAPEMTLAELTRLKDICDTYSQRIQSGNNQEEKAKTDSAISMDIGKISVVEYDCRSLEKLQSRVDVSLACHGHSPAGPSDEQQAIVQSVVNEWSTDLSNYLPKVNAPGSRMTSYRQPMSGATCVTFLEMPESLRQILVEFRIAVDLEFPGRYSWLAEKSWHCTLRSLDTTTASR